MEMNTAKKVYKEALEMSKCCVKVRTIIEFIRGTTHQGYTMSYDESMILAYYEDGVVFVSTNGNPELFKNYE